MEVISHLRGSLVPGKDAIQDKVNDFEAHLKLCTVFAHHLSSVLV